MWRNSEKNQQGSENTCKNSMQYENYLNITRLMPLHDFYPPEADAFDSPTSNSYLLGLTIMWKIATKRK
jgi:hypothetical protein